jgi:hypothetical protein
VKNEANESDAKVEVSILLLGLQRYRSNSRSEVVSETQCTI